RPKSYQSDLARLPEALGPLTVENRWVLWRWEQAANKKTGELNWTKVPYRSVAPQQRAKANDPTTWGTNKEALRVWQRGQSDGIGYCLFGGDIGAFDLDHCRDPETGSLAAWAVELIERVASYTEITVSGSGLRILGYARGDKIHRKQHDGDVE